MKRNVIAGLLCLSLVFGLAACSGANDAKAPPAGDSSNADVPASGEAVSTAIGCPSNMSPYEENVYPYMGVSLNIPEKLLHAIWDNTVFMATEEDVEHTDLKEPDQLPADWRPDPKQTILHSGSIEFLFLPEGMRERAPHAGMKDPMSYEEYQTWITDALPMARLGMYRTEEFTEDMLSATGYEQHHKLGQTKEYVYYLSRNAVPEGQTQEAKDLFATLSALEQGISVQEPKPADEHYFGIVTPEANDRAEVGAFNAQTLDGVPVDQTIFADKKLTMLNVWTTWCGACITEMPDLEALSHDVRGMDAQVIGLVCDASDLRGEIDEELLELAQQIVKRTGVTFPTLVPDKTLHDGLLKGMLGYPTTFFVDEQGDLVGEPVLGSNSKDDWMKLIQERLAEVDG